MKQEKRRTLKKILYIFFGLIITFLVVNHFLRKSKLNKDSERGIVKITEINKSISNPTRSSRTSLHFQFKTLDNKIIKGSKKMSPGTIKVGDCFEVVYSRSSPKINDISFGRKVTCIE